MMKFDKFTIKVQEAVISGRSLAQTNDNQQIEPVHLLISLIEQEDGITKPLLQKLGVNVNKFLLDLEKDLKRLNSIMKHEPELRSWMEAWSIGSVYEMYNSGEKFFKYYRKLKESIYKEKNELELIK